MPDEFEAQLERVKDGQIRVIGLLARMKKIMDAVNKPFDVTKTNSYGDNCPLCESRAIHLDPDSGNYVCNDCHAEF